ncbi:hypothetical protein KC349_g102 [Hortaea werneckii]|nr:hypothetical protein KC349_g102 [Hortaea werneckii]
MCLLWVPLRIMITRSHRASFPLAHRNIRDRIYKLLLTIDRPIQIDLTWLRPRERYHNTRLLVSVSDAEEFATRRKKGTELLHRLSETIPSRPKLRVFTTSKMTTRQAKEGFKEESPRIQREATKYGWEQWLVGRSTHAARPNQPVQHRRPQPAPLQPARAPWILTSSSASLTFSRCTESISAIFCARETRMSVTCFRNRSITPSSVGKGEIFGGVLGLRSAYGSEGVALCVAAYVPCLVCAASKAAITLCGSDLSSHFFPLSLLCFSFSFATQMYLAIFRKVFEVLHYVFVVVYQPAFANVVLVLGLQYQASLLISCDVWISIHTIFVFHIVQARPVLPFLPSSPQSRTRMGLQTSRIDLAKSRIWRRGLNPSAVARLGILILVVILAPRQLGCEERGTLGGIPLRAERGATGSVAYRCTELGVPDSDACSSALDSSSSPPILRGTLRAPNFFIVCEKPSLAIVLERNTYSVVWRLDSDALSGSRKGSWSRVVKSDYRRDIQVA